MNTANLEFFLKENVSLSLDHFLINLTLAAILSFIVQIFYMRFSTTLSNISVSSSALKYFSHPPLKQ